MNDATMGAGVPSAAGANWRNIPRLPIVLFVLTLLVNVYAVVSMVPTFEGLYADLGGELPFGAKIITSLSASGLLLPAVLLANVVLFGVAYRLAQRRGSGWLYVPSFINLLVPPVLSLALYQPMFSIINLIE